MLIINKGAVAKQNAKREVFPVHDREEMEKEYAWRKRVLSGERIEAGVAAGYSGSFRPLDSVQDPGTMRKQMLEYKKNLERGAPVKLSPKVRNQLWLKAKVLKDSFVKGMVHKSELHPVKQRMITINGVAKMAAVVDNDKLTATRAIERNYTWDKQNQNKVKEFKRIVRLLEPNDKNIANVERFRPD